MRRAVVLVLLLLPLALAACGGGGDSGTTTEAAATTTTAAATTTAESGGAVACVDAKAPKASERTPDKPSGSFDTSKTYEVTMKTNCGSFAIALDPAQSPKAVESFVSLANQGYFDNTVFHRIVPGFVIQGGDPTATGTGGPGYSTVDTPPADAQYTHGVVAMAKTQDEAPGTAGSQFFVVTATDASLPPEYAIVGRVTEGLPVVDAIGQFGDPSDPAGTATKVVVIEKATVIGS
jgi:cyclophilin family peptidyl-prolyl cis-trans isomerase